MQHLLCLKQILIRSSSLLWLLWAGENIANALTCNPKQPVQDHLNSLTVDKQLTGTNTLKKKTICKI